MPMWYLQYVCMSYVTHNYSVKIDKIFCHVVSATRLCTYAFWCQRSFWNSVGITLVGMPNTDRIGKITFYHTSQASTVLNDLLLNCFHPLAEHWWFTTALVTMFFCGFFIYNTQCAPSSPSILNWNVTRSCVCNSWVSTVCVLYTELCRWLNNVEEVLLMWMRFAV